MAVIPQSMEKMSSLTIIVSLDSNAHYGLFLMAL